MRTQLVAGGLALALSGLAVGIVSLGVSASAQSPRKPRPTATATATPTATASPTATGSPTTQPSATDSAPPSPTSTVTPTSSPSAPTCSATVTYQDQSWCPGTIAGVDRGTYGPGARIVLQGVIVDSVEGSSVTIMGWWCPPGSYCGGMMEVTTVDFSGLSDVPPVGAWIDLYGITGAPGVFQPVGFVVVG